MKRVLLVLSIAALITSCSDDDSDSGSSQLTLDIDGLEALGDYFAYEGWIIVDGEPVSTGTFSVTGMGSGAQLSETTFNVNSAQLAAATMFVLSIEPVPDNDPEPAKTKILSGAFSGNTATLGTGHVGTGFETATGKYIIATPTGDPESDADDFSGVWFLDNSSGSAMAGLNLPTLEEGWKYEGWAVVDGTALTTGTFLTASGSDDSAPFSGTNPAPPFPGEDYLVNAPAGLTFPTDLRGGTVVISIEPDPDNSPAPFTLKPLLDMVPATLSGNPYSIANNTVGSFPSGSVSR